MTNAQAVAAFNEAARTLKSAMQASTLTGALDHAYAMVDDGCIRRMMHSTPATASVLAHVSEDLSATAAVHLLLAEFENTAAHVLRVSGKSTLAGIPAMGLGIDLT